MVTGVTCQRLFDRLARCSLPHVTRPMRPGLASLRLRNPETSEGKTKILSPRVPLEDPRDKKAND